MAGESRRGIIKALQTALPRGQPIDLNCLQKHGVSPQLAAYYVQSGWLERLANGVYAWPDDELSLGSTLQFLRRRMPGLHIGGKSALTLHGVRHNIVSGSTQVLWGNRRHDLPDWFTERFPSRYVYARLFAWQNEELARATLTVPPGVDDGMLASVQERAILELLYEVGVDQDLDEARNIFQLLRYPRVRILGELLSVCASVKVVRLFLTWARETQVVDVDRLLNDYPVRVGSASRWIRELDDGTVLNLKPYG